MSFECCATCGHVESRARRGSPFGQPAGRCPQCGRTTYWTATPFAHTLVSRRAAANGSSSRVVKGHP
jgi:hypothetical protein